MKTRMLWLILLLQAIALPAVLAQEGWVLKKQENGIAVYARQLSDQDFKQIRVLCELPGTPAQLAAVLKDVSHHHEWVYLNRKSTLLRKKSEEDLIYHTEADMPWPLDDRDLVVEARFFLAPGNNKSRIEVRGLPDYLPVKKDFVRIPYSLAVWEIQPLPGNKMKIEYTFSVNPGGSVPAWLVNATVGTGPYNTFSKLREVLARKSRD